MRFLFFRFIKFISLLVLAVLAGCSTQTDWLLKKRYYPGWEFSPRQVNSYSFQWEKQGDTSLFPRQIFSTQDEVWLSFAQSDALPVILGINPHTGKEQVLNYYYNPPYIVLKGFYSQLRLRAEQREAVLWHRP